MDTTTFEKNKTELLGILREFCGDPEYYVPTQYISDKIIVRTIRTIINAKMHKEEQITLLQAGKLYVDIRDAKEAERDMERVASNYDWNCLADDILKECGPDTNTITIAVRVTKMINKILPSDPVTELQARTLVKLAKSRAGIE